MKYTFMENFKDKDPEFYDFYSHFIGEEIESKKKKKNLGGGRME